MPVEPRVPPARRVFLTTWAAASLFFVILCGLWSLSTPIPSGPDEPTQYVKATAVAHGTLTGEHRKGFPPGTVLVHVPGTFVLYDPGTGCYYLHPTVPAGCTRPPNAGSDVQATTTYVGEYPPLYYAITGLPTLVSNHPLTRRAMRGMSTVVSSLLLGVALAAAVTWSRSRWLVVGVALAVTPTAVYLASVLNPNGLEISAALAAWTAGVLLVFDHDARPPPGLVAVFAASAVTLALTRPLSPLWLVGIVGALSLIRPAAARRLVADKAVRVGLAVTGAAIAIAVLFVVINGSLSIEKFPLTPGLSDLQVASLVAGRVPLHVWSMVGQFGGPEFTAPSLAVGMWVVGVGALVCVAASISSRWEATVLILTVVGLLVVLPFAATYPEARTHGLVWQGRYQYPAAVGIPLLATALLGKARTNMGRSGGLAATAIVIVHVATFYWVLRRYTVGLGSFVNAFAHVPGGWRPPVSAVVLAGLVTLVSVGSGVWLVSRLRRPLRLEATGPVDLSPV
ncbi:MAG: hypothetical protein V7605_1030 [Acidimicrobiaceae bacterium]